MIEGEAMMPASLSPTLLRVLGGLFCLAALDAVGAQQIRTSPNTQNACGLEIPTTRPRLWWTPERLAQARAWYAANSFNPGRTDYLGQAFRFLMTGETAYA